MLQQARSERTALERRGEELEGLFDQNNQEIAARTAELDERLGTLKELFGVLQQVSGDTLSVFRGSVTNVQYPDREQFLIDLGNRCPAQRRLRPLRTSSSCGSRFSGR